MRKITILFICIVLLLITACKDGSISKQNTGADNDNSNKIELTIGGVWISNIPIIHRAVAEFNQNNETYMIQIKDYIDPADEDLESALLRMHTEVIAGGGPDIIFDNFRRMFNGGPFLDLYPFIDADPELKREDFFPNMLKSMERPDGTLPMFANSFQDISIMISTTEILGHIDKWTPSEFLKLAEDNPDMPYPFGVQTTGQMFIYDILRLNSADFINTQTYKANIDSPEFILLLEAAKKFSQPSDESKTPNEDEIANDFFRMLKGEQLLSQYDLYGVKYYQLIAEIFGNNLVTMGLPSNNGGEYYLNVNAMMGINANTKHADTAWEFLRMFLLPSAEFDEFQNFPLRIDLYEALVDDIMTPRYEINEDGNYIEVPHAIFILDSYAIHQTTTVENAEGIVYELYAMPENIAENLRSLVESAKVARSFFPAGLNMIIYADLDAYFSGGRSAEETARIMQNRIETYLSELQLLAEVR